MAEDDLSKSVYLECECNSFDHTVRVSLIDWTNHGEPPEAFIDYRLNNCEYWYERVWSAIKYVFLRGELEYHDVLLTEGSIDKLSSFCRDYKLAKELYELGKSDDSRKSETSES